MLPRATIEAFDDHLAECGLRLDAIVVGGSALVLLGVIERQTRDVDIVHPKLSEQLVEAARSFAATVRGGGVELDDDWLNNGPIQVGRVLPPGWQERTRALFQGAAMTLTTLGRDDLLKTKLFALCDRGTDVADCVALAPTPAELEEAEPWLARQDANPGWPAHVRETLADLGRRMGHGV